MGRGGPFGVRRPLRMLTYKLDLKDEQVAELADIIDELKTERAQSAVDDRRAHRLYVAAISGEAFDAEEADKAAQQRIASTERVQRAVVEALRRLHGILEPEQRAKLGTLIRSGFLSF